ncbi:rootletin-like [Impatiens glandulifera]|uniref:rootletin-like n=1 Tax=Impatiens glandulifera TaxID=253017 RepID=UPI001FB09617|nr:rootletin-like [Impatiens glandulifera]
MEFYYNARVFRGTPHFETHIQSKVGGVIFDFTEQDFGRCFSLPKQGITDLNPPADIKAEVSLAFARSDEPVNDHDDKHVIYPESVLEFFYNAKVFRGTPHFDKHIQSKVGGIVFDFTESDFARSFDLPKQGLTDLAEISLAFAWSNQPVDDHGAKSLLKDEYQLLNDVISRGILGRDVTNTYCTAAFNMMAAITTVGLVPQLSCLLLELGVPPCPGEGLNQAQEAVEEFFQTVSLAERTITATVSGQQLELTEESVADILRLPSEGTNLPSTLEQETFEAACQVLSETKVPIGVSGKKTSLRPEYRPLCDIFTKSVQARGGNYDSLTRAKIEMLAGLIMLHHNINTGLDVLLSSSKIIRSRQFTDRKSTRKVSGSIGGRRKKGAVKKVAPVKEKSGGKKDKQPIESADPQSETPNEDDLASNSDRTNSHNTEEDQSGKGEDRISEDQSASLDNADTGADGPGEEDVHANDNTQEVAENIVSRIMEEINQHGREASEVLCQWIRHRHHLFYKDMLPGLSVGQKFERLMEMEEEVIILTKAEDAKTALDRYALIEPRARLIKLTEHIQCLREKHTPDTPNSQLQLLVLELLAVKERELSDEVARLEVVPERQETTNSLSHRDDGGQNSIDEVPASPPADQTIQMTDERTETPLTDTRAFDQPRDSEPAITEERVISIIEEFANDVVRPWKKKIKKTTVQAVKISETTRDDLGEAVKRITSAETNYGNADVLYDAHLKRTKALEDMTPKLVDDLESVSKKVDEDLERSSAQAGSILDRVISLEEKNTSLEERNTKLEADLKAVTEQVTELIKAKLATDKATEEANSLAARQLQDALDEETRKKMEAAWSDANIAKHLRNIAVTKPDIAKTMAATQAEDAKRLQAQKQLYEDYAKIHKKS